MERQINMTDGKNNIFILQGELAEEACAELIQKYSISGKQNVVLLTYETVENTIQHILCCLGGVEVDSALQGKMTKDDWQKIIAASCMLRESNLKILNYDNSVAEKIKTQCTEALDKTEHPDLIIFFAHNMQDAELASIIAALKDNCNKIVAISKIQQAD